MTAWSKRNFDDLPDSSPDGEPMTWNFAREALGFEDIGVSRFRFEPGSRMPWGHSHRTQEEGYVVVAGSGWLKLGDEREPLRPGDVVRVSREAVRGLEAGPDGLEVICIGGPGATRGDGIRDADFWGA